MKKEYKLKKSPGVRISIYGVRFVNGKGATADPELQKALENRKNITEIKTKPKKEAKKDE